MVMDVVVGGMVMGMVIVMAVVMVAVVTVGVLQAVQQLRSCADDPGQQLMGREVREVSVRNSSLK